MLITKTNSWQTKKQTSVIIEYKFRSRQIKISEGRATMKVKECSMCKRFELYFSSLFQSTQPENKRVEERTVLSASRRLSP